MDCQNGRAGNSIRSLTTALLVCWLGLSGCSKSEGFTLVAAPNQIGTGSTIRVDGTGGFVTMLPTAGYPKGFTGTIITEGEGIEGKVSPTGRTLKMRLPEQRISLTFIAIGNHYVCQDCIHLKLPLTWMKMVP